MTKAETPTYVSAALPITRRCWRGAGGLLSVAFLVLLWWLLGPFAGFAADGAAGRAAGGTAISLNGAWQMGFGRQYTSTVQVPGIAADPTVMSAEELWYKREVTLPPGKWQTATLELKGARFRPRVYINNQLVGQQSGGMAPTFFRLKPGSLRPGSTVTLEVALASLKNVPPTDASFIPWADHWRSNVSSGLWDRVVLHLHGPVGISRVIPFVDYDHQQATIRFDLSPAGNFRGNAAVRLLDARGQVVATAANAVAGSHGEVRFPLGDQLRAWSPATPNVYTLELAIRDQKGALSDKATSNFGIRKFEVQDKHFRLNNAPFVAKGPTVVWPRWVRTPEGRALGYDTAWFRQNIIQRTKDLGGNYLRFHLGLPPERFLDLCDRHGLVVQYEWSFFHGMPASKESLLEQYKSWLDLAMRHPSVSLIHPYNETGGEQLTTAWAALDELLKSYPPLVLEDRDVLHIHKYWWSLFENVGLYYDDAAVFPKAVMADEFGGNYLDGNGDLGQYSTVKETFLRFLGRSHTAAERLAFQAQANAKIAEYWRRVGAAGWSPFCALGSNEDGNHWFLGPLAQGRPKPVWAALAAAFSPQAASLELWDRDFEVSQALSVPVYVFNDEPTAASLAVQVTIENPAGKLFYTHDFTASVGPFAKKIQPVPVVMPPAPGDYVLKATLLNKPAAVKQPVVSEWNFRVYQATVPANVRQLKIAVPAEEAELRKLCAALRLKTVAPAAADVLVTSLTTWNRLARGDAALAQQLQAAINKGTSVVMLDVGDRPLGQGYPAKAGEVGPLQSVVRLGNPAVHRYDLFGGISLKFTETAEPESHLHPASANQELWQHLPKAYTWLWNGLRGGLIVPAADMEFSGLSAKAFLAQWKSRGAPEEKVKTGSCYAYELQGFYEFSDQAHDPAAEKKLKDKVVFLVQDAPALANSINPDSPVLMTDLASGYREAQQGIADNLIPLANCAKNLTQTPVALVDFGPGKGKLIVSQLLTAGRLAKGADGAGLYDIRYDEVAVQYTLNMLSVAAKK